MKRQILSLIAGAALVITPVVASGLMQPATAQGFGGGGFPAKMAKELNLTEQQQAQFKALREKTRSQIEAVLTPEQRAKAQAALQEKMAKVQQGDRQPGEKRGKRGGGMKGMFQSLNLTETQKTQIKAIMQASREEGSNILTPEQKAQVQQKMAQRMKQRNQ
jgi:periplasmic protein CpxP/Spy